MKKVLLATTALVLTAGVASAEMSLSGDGYVGMSGTTDSLAYDSRFNINMNGSIESDSGLSVAARVRIRSNEQGVSAISEPRFNVTAGAVTVSFGNTADAMAARSNPYGSCVGNLGDYCGTSSWGSDFDSDDDARATTTSVTDRVRLDYTAGDMTVSVSGQLDGDEDLQVGVSAAMSGVNLNVAYKPADITDTEYAVDVSGTFGSMNAGLRYDQAAGYDAVVGLYGNTTMGATTLSAFVNNSDDADILAWGVGASHDLGGGVALGAAIADGDAAQAHISFSF
jgi:outer membrane protein OmpU